MFGLCLWHASGTGSHPSQLDKAHMRDEYGVYGGLYDPYEGMIVYEAEQGEKRILPAQPYSRPSHLENIHRPKPNPDPFGGYHPGVALGRGTQGGRGDQGVVLRRGSAGDQYDSSHRKADPRHRMSGGHYEKYTPGSMPADEFSGRTRPAGHGTDRQRGGSLTSQYDVLHRTDQQRGPGGQYEQYRTGSAPSDRYASRGGPKGTTHAHQGQGLSSYSNIY